MTTFDISDLIRKLRDHFGSSVTMAEIKKNYHSEKKVGRHIKDFFYGDTKEFDIIRIKSGRSPHVIFINGFLTADCVENLDWKEQLAELYPENACYHLRWNSKQLGDLGLFLGTLVGKASMPALMNATGMQVLKIALKETKIPVGPLIPATLLYDLATNPWFQALYRAEQTGILLADYIHQNRSRTYILLGHSLGARVIFHALKRLADKDEGPVVEEVRLLGGAVDAKHSDEWHLCARTTRNGIYNYHSCNDKVLSILYKTSTIFTGRPIGNHPVSCSGVRNRDCSGFVGGHNEYINHLCELYRINPFSIEIPF